MFKFELNTLVRDMTTGFEGKIAVCSEYVGGYITYAIVSPYSRIGGSDKLIVYEGALELVEGSSNEEDSP